MYKLNKSVIAVSDTAVTFAKQSLALVALLVMMSSCATIFGGSKYVATIKPTKPNSEIFVNGVKEGTGSVTIKHKRNKIMHVQVKNSGTTTETQVTKKFRWGIQGATLGASLFLWPVLPIGLAVDLISGSAFKPNENIKGVKKVDNKHYDIIINNGDD